MAYLSKNHSKYSLTAHLIFVCKYRKPLLTIYGNEIKCLFADIACEHDFEIITMECDKDHIHVLISYHPKQSILDIARLLKQISTFRIWRHNKNANYLATCFWKEQTFWSDGYFVCSVGNASQETIEAYIRDQG